MFMSYLMEVLLGMACLLGMLLLDITICNLCIVGFTVTFNLTPGSSMDNSDVQGTPITVLPTPTPMIDDSVQDRYRHFPIRVATFSAVLLPMVLLPYLLTTRRTRMLRQRINELQGTTRTLQRELNAAQAKLLARQEEGQNLQAALRSVVRKTDATKQRITELTAENVTGRNDLNHLLAEAEQSRTQTAALRALGSSIADIAAFMHEVELQTGIEPLSRDARRRVDRLRSSALRLQNLTVTQQRAASEGEEPSAKAAAGQKE